jgi:hypothetical protein
MKQIKRGKVELVAVSPITELVLVGCYSVCTKCEAIKPLHMVGLRRLSDGSIRNQSQCNSCRTESTKRRRKKQKIPKQLDFLTQ